MLDEYHEEDHLLGTRAYSRDMGCTTRPVCMERAAHGRTIREQLLGAQESKRSTHESNRNTGEQSEHT